MKSHNCRNDTAVSMKLVLPESTDFAIVSGVVTVREDITGDIDLVLESSRCSLDFKSCSKENTMNVKGMCKLFKEKNAFYSKIFDAFQPNLDCYPLKAGDYILKDTLLDLKFAKLLPIDNYVFVDTFKWITNDKRSRSKKVVMCFYLEVKVTSANRRVR